MFWQLPKQVDYGHEEVRCFGMGLHFLQDPGSCAKLPCLRRAKLSVVKLSLERP